MLAIDVRKGSPGLVFKSDPSLYTRQELLHHFKSGGAMLYILAVHMQVIGHRFFGEVRKFSTISRTNGIDAAKIGFQVKELAGSRFVYPFPFPVFQKPFLPEPAQGQTQVPGNSFLVLVGIGRGHVAATVGTGKAVRFFPYFPLNGIRHLIKAFWRMKFYPGQKTPETGTIWQHFLLKAFPDIGHKGVYPEGKRILKGKKAALIFVDMRSILFMLITALTLIACQNKTARTAKTFCDTTCRSDSFQFKGKDRFESRVSISVKNCRPDSVSVTHGGMDVSRTIPFTELVSQEVRLNPAAISCVIRDTSYAWLTFNDCITGRGFLFKLPFNKYNNISKISGALNSFDPKFVVAEDLRAYTDRGSIFVLDIYTGKQAVMTFKDTYDIDFDKLHETVDSINVSHKRIYVKLLKKGSEVPLEKTIDL